MRGNFEHAYQLLTSYFAEVRLDDPDFVFDIQTTSCKDKRFTRCFCCFGPPKKTYKLLRPVVVIDKTFLKGRYRGTLLTAIAIDPSNHIFPLAFFDNRLGDHRKLDILPGDVWGLIFTIMILDSSSSLTGTSELLMLYPRYFHLQSIRFAPSTYRTTLKLSSKVRGSHLGWQQRT
ncbi:hypothetical protein GIB67_014033 [Kingdonia uniflora]|uniref:Transposase n=1 Tax=Kingdonia uniflora TaxID=39325 RepID=A0A7J7L5R4_9MAGN|nr:hypothetical protein GIB67_014033 [Kingdonia uniflora]